MTPNPNRIKKGMYWDRAWSLVEGCTPVSEGCLNCWSARQTHMREKHPNQKIRARHEGLTDAQGRWTGKVRLVWDDIEKPLHVKKSTVWAIWNDLFHADVPGDFIVHVCKIMCACPQHVFIILTKRPQRMESVLYGEEGNWYLGGGDYLPNVWLGVTVENQQRAKERIPILLQIPAAKRFVSIEPMLSQVRLNDWILNEHKGPDPFETQEEFYQRCNERLAWVILGGESGPGARLIHPDWVRSVRDLCVGAGIPFFFKQWGEWSPIITSKMESMVKVGKRQAGRLLDGREWNEVP